MTPPRALITGAGIRVGREIALALAEAGFDLILHAHRSVEALQSAADKVALLGRQATLMTADLSTVEGCEALIARTWQLGGVDVLVNSAAAYEKLNLDQIDAPTWDRMIALNTRAPFLLVRGLSDALAASSRPGGGVVINIGDIGGERPVPGYVHYSVSKAGLLMLTRALALELAPAIRVNAVNPGTVLAPEHLDETVLSAIKTTIPLNRFGHPSDIARTVVFLVQSPYITGQIISVDGGRSVGGPMEAG